MYNTVKSAKPPGSCHYLIMSSCHHSFVFNIGSHGQINKHNQLIRGCPKMMMAFFCLWLPLVVMSARHLLALPLVLQIDDIIWGLDRPEPKIIILQYCQVQNKYIFNMVCSNLTRLCRSKLTLVNILTISEIEHP